MVETVEGVESVAVRRDWPDGRHDFVGFTMTPDDALRFVLWSRVRWRRRRFRPAHTVVAMDLSDLLRHRGLCRGQDCPPRGTAADEVRRPTVRRPPPAWMLAATALVQLAQAERGARRTNGRPDETSSSTVDTHRVER